MKLILSVLTLSVLFSCTTVDPGHKGVEVSWGGKTNLEMVYPEGMHTGFKWIWDDMIEYDVREKTIVERFEFNDKNNMVTVVELSLDYAINSEKVAFLHTRITDLQTKILKTLKSAGKEVVPQYSAIELNIHKRAEAEEKLSSIMRKELAEFYVDFARIQMTDVDIPQSVSDLAQETAVQLGRNELALKKEAEQVALAQAEIARAKGAYEAATYDAKTKDILSQPKMLELQRIENERIIAEGFKKHGKSIYGEHNYFGAGAPVLLKDLK